MRGRDGGTDGDAVVRLLPRVAPAAVLLTDDPDGAVRLLCAALSSPAALEDPDRALQAVVRVAARRRRWAAEQVIESLLRSSSGRRGYGTGAIRNSNERRPA